jgi:CBS domain-containing protein
MARELIVSEFMTQRDECAVIAPAATVREAAALLADTRAGDLMVVDDLGAFVGKVCEGDILRTALPDLDEILGAGGTLADAYSTFTRKVAELSAKSITPLVITDPIVLNPDDHLAAATSILVERQIRQIPVVSDGLLVGVVSRADVCRALTDA